MFSLSRNFLKFAAASAFVAFPVSGTPTCADEMAQNLGPVGPHEPMITTVGDAAAAFNYYERPQGFRPGGSPEGVHRWPVRLQNTQALAGATLPPQGGRSGPPPGSPMPQTNVVVAPPPQALPAPRASQFSTAGISQANRPLPQGTPSYGVPSQGASGQPSSASAAEPSKFCKATAATVGLSAKDRFMAWCEAEARQASGVPTEPPGPGMGRALRQN
jgi:hypothetical protein